MRLSCYINTMSTTSNENLYRSSNESSVSTRGFIASGARIEVLDVIRGIAILAILFFNIPDMGNTNYEHFGASQLLGWRPADQVCWWFLEVVVEGTQRGLLQILFGAGALILLRNTMQPDGPVAAADLFFRRNLWLILFGIFDIFGLLWYGDILLEYAIAALFLFPFRKLSAPILLTVTLLFVGYTTVEGSVAYRAEVAQYHAAMRASEKQTQHLPLSGDDQKALAAHAKSLAIFHLPPAVLEEERSARFGTLPVYTRWMHGVWFKYVWGSGAVPSTALESFFYMLLGMALFKLGIMQGDRTSRFYLGLTLLCYGLGLSERIYGTWQRSFFQGIPNVETATGEAARLLVSVGHLALINLCMKTSAGRAFLSPFQAAGRMAFSLYLLQNFLCDWILFPGIGLGLWGRFGWFGLSMAVLALSAAQVVFANLWLKRFTMGPLEWVWRSLSRQRLQPFRHQQNDADPVLA